MIRPASADADDALHIVFLEQFERINTDGRTTHATRPHGHLMAVVGSGIKKHIACVAYQLGVLQEIVGNKLGTKRIAGHKHNGRYRTSRCTDV